MSSTEITPTRCGEFASLLRAAIDRLDARGIVVSGTSRLEDAVRVLEHTASVGSFPTGREEQFRLSTACRDAVEWDLITDVLGSTVDGVFRKDIQEAVGGLLVQKLATGWGPQQLQAQLVFGAILVQDGIELGAPTRQGMPDFVFENGTLWHGIEIKAPTSRRGITDAVAKADRQLCRLSGCGMLVVDVTWFVDRGLAALPAVPASESEIEALTRRYLVDVKAQVRTEVERRGSWRLGRGVAATAVVCRVATWRSESRRSIPVSSFAVKWRRYYGTPGSLTYWRATALGDRVGEALAAVMPDIQIVWEH